MLEQRLMGFDEFRDLCKNHLVNHFPADEVKPLEMMEKIFKEGKYLSYGYYEGDTLMAYTIFLQKDNLLLLDYFAVMEQMRGSGRGSEIVDLMKSQLGDEKIIFLEVEEPNAKEDEVRDLQERRIQFYLRNGAGKTGVMAKTFNVQYIILTIGSDFYGIKAQNAMETLYHTMLPDNIYEKNVFFHLDNQK